MVLQTVANKTYLASHFTPNWSMDARNLIQPENMPKTIDIVDATWSFHQLIQFSHDTETYYAIFYIEKDGYLPKDIDAFHYDYANGASTFVTRDLQLAMQEMQRIKDRKTW